MDLPFINDPSNIFYAGDDPHISSAVHSCMIQLGKVIAGSSEKDPKQKQLAKTTDLLRRKLF